jgi:hypothetical protein
MEADPEEGWRIPMPCRWLYERAREDKIYSSIDSDAFPLRTCWLAHLIQALDHETVLAGAWRENKPVHQPYIPPPVCMPPLIL